MRIFTNTTSLNAQSSLSRSQQSLGGAIERLSSGLRVNSAKDDAAGQAISNRMTSSIRGNYVAERNVRDAQSLVNTALGGMDEINNNLQRIRELRVQALNGTNSVEDRQSIQTEIDQRLREIDRISGSTSFNELGILQKDKSLNIQVGATESDTFDLELKAMNLVSLGLKDDRFGTITSTYELGGITYDVSFSGAVRRDGTFMNLEETAKFFGVSSSDIGIVNLKYPNPALPGGYFDTPVVQIGDRYLLAGNTDIMPDGSINFSLSEYEYSVSYADPDSGIPLTNRGKPPFFEFIGFTENDEVIRYVNYEGDQFKSYQPFLYASGPNKNTVNIASPTSTTLGKLDAALDKINEYRSELGAVSNRLDSMASTLEGENLSLEAARSRIMDADYALEVSNMTRNQILQQAGQSVLAQANQLPKGILALLQ